MSLMYPKSGLTLAQAIHYYYRCPSLGLHTTTGSTYSGTILASNVSILLRLLELELHRN